MATASKLSGSLMRFKTRKNDKDKTRAEFINEKRSFTFQRRNLFLLSAAIIADSRAELLNKYLEKSQENKAKNDKERLDSYYKRNYRDYFGLFEGELSKKKELDLTESEKGILEWLEKNK